MFKRNIFKILAVVFFLLAGASFYNSNRIKPVVVKKIPPTIISTPTPVINPTITGQKFLSPTVVVLTQIIIQPTSSAEVSAKAGSSDSPTSPPPTSAPQGLKVSLSINGSSVGLIDVSKNANQCDVLSQALSQGKIQSLNMKYNNDMGTNAVYQINGIGKENAVWWVFKVNGQSPSQGCSYIKVNNGDNSEWSYIGN